MVIKKQPKNTIETSVTTIIIMKLMATTKRTILILITMKIITILI